ncbi:MAG: wax ester/triacylglycerol synthase family O-acyltransferase [Mycobacterium sp.]|nr:wax ester/triacylglycerol synthase family O-acyltransferase [Mycobacterium sp.]
MEPFAALETLMLAAEKLGSPMHVGVLLILSPPPDATPKYVDTLYRESLTAPDDVDPRLRRFPHRGVDTGGVWVWRQAAEVDLHRHLHRTTLPSGSGLAELWELVSELHSERLDLAAPLWASWLIDGFDEGRAGGAFALYIKVHHTLIDGVGGVQMIADTMSPDPDRRGMPPFYVDRHAPEPTEAEGSGRRFFRPLEGIRAITETAAAALDLTRRVAAAELTNFIGGLTSDAVVGPLAAPRTRFNTRLGPRRAAAGTSVSRERIGAIRRAAGVTTNDVITAVISGVLHQWLSQVGELPRRSLVAMCPVSVRPRDSSTSGTNGNRFGLGLCPLGTDLDDPAARLALIHDAMSRIKHQVAERGANATLAVMGPAIGSTVLLPLLPFGGVIPPSCNLAISNVPGPAEHIYYNGARLDEIYPVSSVFDGMGLNVTVCCYADRVEVGYVTDAELMDDIGVLVPLTHAAVTDLEAAVGISTP